LDTEILQWESWLVAEKDLQPRKQTFHPKTKQATKRNWDSDAGTQESSVRDVVHSVVTENRRFLVLE